MNKSSRLDRQLEQLQLNHSGHHQESIVVQFIFSGCFRPSILLLRHFLIISHGLIDIVEKTIVSENYDDRNQIIIICLLIA